MTLENILIELGAKKPFDKSGELSPNGTIAFEKLVKVVAYLHSIGAICETPDAVEAYCDEIIRLGE